MLKEIRISNFAIIDQQSIFFSPGLNVISGETGSGKSIVLNAIELLLGAKSKASLLRAGAEELEVEALFDLSELPKNLFEELPDYARGEELLLSRTLGASGKSKIYVNGRISTLNLLQEVSSKLVNLCGQGQYMRLLDPKYHLNLIDDYADNTKPLEEYCVAFKEWKAAEQALKAYGDQFQYAEKRREELEQIVTELKPLNPKAGLREELQEQVRVLAGAGTLLDRLQAAVEILGNQSALSQNLSCLVSHLNEASKYDQRLGSYLERVQNLRAESLELRADLERHSKKISVDQRKLEQIRDNLAEISRLERRYAKDSGGLKELLESAEKELEIADEPQAEKKLVANLQESKTKLESKAAILSKSRVTASKKLVHQVEAELKDLNMSSAKLNIDLQKLEAPNISGTDQLEILISSNQGELYKKLREVASGGELARITLVLKKVLREASGVNVLVFDEVDSGVSGKVARAMGEKLKALAKSSSQVICITHLPQVASLADNHLLVEKSVTKGRTVSKIRRLEAEGRIEEIARMLAGKEITELSRKSALELLRST